MEVNNQDVQAICDYIDSWIESGSSSEPQDWIDFGTASEPNSWMDCGPSPETQEWVDSGVMTSGPDEMVSQSSIVTIASIVNRTKVILNNLRSYIQSETTLSAQENISWLKALIDNIFLIWPFIGRLDSMDEDERCTFVCSMRYVSELLSKIPETPAQELFQECHLDVLLLKVSNAFTMGDGENCLAELSKFRLFSEIVQHLQHVEIRRILLNNMIQLVQENLKELKKRQDDNDGVLKPTTIIALSRCFKSLEYICRNTNKGQPWMKETELAKIKCIENYVYTALPFLNVALEATNIRILAEQRIMSALPAA